MSSVGKSIPHDSATGHVTGEALFIDDMPRAANELYIDCAGSPVAKGALVSIDASAAREIPGVIAIYTHRDIPGHNQFGPIFEDENLLAVHHVSYIGEPVALIAAESHKALELAKKAIKIIIREEKPILTIQEAIANKNFIGVTRTIARGNSDEAIASARHTLRGVLTIGGQDHFYLESQACLAIPGEDGAVTVYSSTQNPSEVQAVVAQLLGVGRHKVVCICKRMGGGFGGKETQAAGPAAMAAIVATKLKRPVRCVFTKDDDMKYTGKRHPYRAEYVVAFDNDGRIDALKVDFYSNGGFSADLSPSVMERTMLHVDNAYFIPHAHITGAVCRTNLPSNTAFRGFGGPQAVACIESIIEDIAVTLRKDPLDVRKINLYGDSPRNLTPYGQIVDQNFLPAIFDQLEKSSDYRNRRKSVESFNRSSRTRLKGLSLTPVKFGISFTKKFLNQGNALVNIYTDGTVQVSTGGTEMGQGLNTKIRQLVADEFAIDVADVLVMPTSTEKNNNTSPTAASASTDLNGTAAVRACENIRRRLALFAAQHMFHSVENGMPPSPEHIFFKDAHVFDLRAPDKTATFRQLVKLAHMERINLGERGFYATPGVDFNRDTGKGTPFLYYTTGAAVAEVTIDRFTGDLKVDRVDLLMDIGKAINLGVDRGQVVGGFVQGMGWCTTEQLIYSDKGALLSYSPTTYKIPGVQDIPRIFNVDFISNDKNTRNVAGSKAVGEPPLLLGLCAWTAVKDALRYMSPTETIKLDLPATGEEILKRLTELKKTCPAKGSGAPILQTIHASKNG
jgi:xanthine dehydrogenase large subunit